MDNIIILNSNKIKILFNWKGVKQKEKDFPLLKMVKGEKNIRKIKYVIDLYFLRIILWGEKIGMPKKEGGYLLKDPYLSELMKDFDKKRA
jgi:hypothetical protein